MGSFLMPQSVVAQSPQELPRLSIDQLKYNGAFRVSADTFGESSMNYSEGPLQYNPSNHSLFMVGHSHQQALAEFAIPEAPGTGTTVADLPLVESTLQSFVGVLDRPTSGNTQNINRIGGMQWFSTSDGPKLVVNGYEYYDAPGDNSHTTLVIDDASSLATSAVRGYFQYQGNAGHTSGWISPIPSAWQDTLGGAYLTGHSSGIPIISRSSVGPSAFVMDPQPLLDSSQTSGTVAAQTLLDFSLQHPLHDDLSNSNGTNDIWTHLSRAVFGMIVPGTRTYLTLGHSGGHLSGVCYKCEQDDGNLCGGYCAPDSDDYYLYYWLWDVNDLLAVKEGTLESYAVRPYEYGEFEAPFGVTSLGGGSFDPQTGSLYLSFQRADREQGQYANPPVIGIYSFAASSDSPDGSVDEEQFIGKRRRTRMYCATDTDTPACLLQRKKGTIEKPASFAVRVFRKSLKRLRLQLQQHATQKGRKRMKRLKKSLKRARQCKRGTL